MRNLGEQVERRTTTDAVYDTLYQQIQSLEIPPGAKLSEAEIAKRFGVSRQPVRDAFSKLENQDLLVIRPQKATKVRGFSLEHVAHSRFVRLAVELEVLRGAVDVWDSKRAETLNKNIMLQEAAVAAGDIKQFHHLDYHFHRLICELGDRPMAFAIIQECKNRIDRLCVLSLGRDSEADDLLQDHKEMAAALIQGNAAEVERIARQHLTRLDETVMQIYRENAKFFEDDTGAS